MNLFLTGQRQVGKSTALAAALAELEAERGIRAAGLASRFGPDRSGLYLVPWGGPQLPDPIYLDASRCCARMDAQGKHPDLGVFDTVGAALVHDAMADPNAGLVVIDELGFLEAGAAAFRAAVLAALAGPKPVLGVVRQGLGAWADVNLGTVWAVTMENRAEMPARICRFLASAD